MFERLILQAKEMMEVWIQEPLLQHADMQGFIYKKLFPNFHAENKYDCYIIGI